MSASHSTFSARAGAADHAQPLQPRDLHRGAADRARRAGDVDRLAFLHLPDHLEPDPGREARHPEHAERGRRRRDGGVELAQPLARDHALLAPAELRDDPVALGEAVGRGTSTTRPTAPPSIGDADLVRRGT